MSDHLQKFKKELFQQPFEMRIPVSTDPAFFEKLGHRKRSDVCYNDFSKRKGREDNFVYNLNDGYNLKGTKHEDTYFDRMLVARLAQKAHEYKNIQERASR